MKMRHVVPLALCLAVAIGSAQDIAERDAAALLDQGKFDQAIPALESLLARSPNDIKVRNLLGIALARTGRQDAAAEQFRKAVEINPRSVPSLKNLALSELALGRPREARAHFEAVLKEAPQDPAAHLGLAEIAFLERRYADAATLYQRSGDLYAAKPEYTLHFAHSCIEARKPELAVQALKRLPEKADARSKFEAGLLLANLEQYSDAAPLFRAAESGLEDPYDAAYNLTLAYIKSKQPALAIESGEKLLAKGYRKGELYNLLSQAYELGGRTKDAYAALRTATELDPSDETNYLDLIALCLDHQNWDLSLEIAGIGLARLPNSYRLHLQRGAVLAMKTQYDAAEQDFSAASRAAPQVALPYVCLALVRMQMNKLPEAIDLLRERRKKTRQDFLVNWFLGEALNRNGVPPGSPEEAEAVQALESAVAANPKAEQARLLLGKFLLKRGNTDRAIEEFNKALELDPTDSSATYQLATAYRKRGDTQRASELFAKVSREKAEAREQFTQRNLVRIIREGTQP